MNSITYAVPFQGRPREEIRAAMRAKYGTPTLDSGRGTMAWCATGDRCVSCGNQFPMIRYDEGDGASLRLDPGSR